MMPRWQAVPLLIALGAVLLWVAHRGYETGELPAGSAWFRSYRPNRDDNPLSFYIHLALYVCYGTWLCVWGLLAMLGMAPSLRWR
jgi:hypothetical protein